MQIIMHFKRIIRVYNVP